MKILDESGTDWHCPVCGNDNVAPADTGTKNENDVLFGRLLCTCGYEWTGTYRGDIIEFIEVLSGEAICWYHIGDSLRIRVSYPLSKLLHLELKKGDKVLWDKETKTAYKYTMPVVKQIVTKRIPVKRLRQCLRK